MIYNSKITFLKIIQEKKSLKCVQDLLWSFLTILVQEIVGIKNYIFNHFKLLHHFAIKLMIFLCFGFNKLLIIGL